MKKDLGKEQIKRDIAKEKDKQKKHGKMPAGELRHKKRKSLETVKTAKDSEQIAGVKNPEDVSPCFMSPTTTSGQAIFGLMRQSQSESEQFQGDKYYHKKNSKP